MEIGSKHLQNRLLQIIELLSKNERRYLTHVLSRVGGLPSEYVLFLLSRWEDSVDWELLDEEFARLKGISLVALKRVRQKAELLVEDLLHARYYGSEPWYRELVRERLAFRFFLQGGFGVFLRRKKPNFDDNLHWFNVWMPYRMEVAMLENMMYPSYEHFELFEQMAGDFILEMLIVLINHFIYEMYSNPALSYEEFVNNKDLFTVLSKYHQYMEQAINSCSSKSIYYIIHFSDILFYLGLYEEARELTNIVLDNVGKIYELVGRCHNCDVLVYRVLASLHRLYLPTLVGHNKDYTQALLNIARREIEKNASNFKGLSMIHKIYFLTLFYWAVRNGVEMDEKLISTLRKHENISLRFKSSVSISRFIYYLNTQEFNKAHKIIKLDFWKQMLSKHPNYRVTWYLMQFMAFAESKDFRAIGKVVNNFFQWTYRNKKANRLSSLLRKLDYNPLIMDRRKFWFDLYEKVRDIYHSEPIYTNIEKHIPFLGWVYSKAKRIKLFEAIASMPELDFRKMSETQRAKMPQMDIELTQEKLDTLRNKVQHILDEMLKA
ncbi:MAG: hypothetical protein GXO48_06035 [Chlorobi bacterium]|nr:hypothetical protein [Chlorobiota bacterium]